MWIADFAIGSVTSALPDVPCGRAKNATCRLPDPVTLPELCQETTPRGRGMVAVVFEDFRPIVSAVKTVFDLPHGALNESDSRHDSTVTDANASVNQ